ncbi:hypothetical protein [Mycobacterium kubicae]|uniref:hypothetical protein n=1 Tax=Mycobacterium kubicae TaxID=120959 RepID=UPI001041C074|nr:hypothetical protein [Mycobacterium kubicae]
MLSDFRPIAARQRFLAHFGPDAAAAEVASAPVIVAWRQQYVLIAAELELDGPFVDLTDVPTRQHIERRHVDLLAAHGWTIRIFMRSPLSGELLRRQLLPISMTAAPRGRFPLRLNGMGCIALLEQRGGVRPAGDSIALTDPPPDPLTPLATGCAERQSNGDQLADADTVTEHSARFVQHDRFLQPFRRRPC